MLSVGSLFSGIGGFDLGLERAGMRTAWFCESEPFCQRVLAKHWPSVPCYPDVRELRGDSVAAVEVLCGGFPCQDISSAGLGAGLAGTRSGLWSEFARLICELRPRYAVVENVPMLRTRGLDQVLEDLTACGYDAEWDGISASAVGAPHRRDRIWIVAYPNGEGEHAGAVDAEVASAPQRPAADAGRFQLRQQPWRSGGEGRPDTPLVAVDGKTQHMADAPRECERESADEADTLAGNGLARKEPSGGGWWLAEPDVGRVADGIPARMDRLRALGNALVPQIAEWIGRRILAYESEGRLAA